MQVPRALNDRDVAGAENEYVIAALGPSAMLAEGQFFVNEGVRRE